MALKKFKPTTPGQRFKVISTFDEITASVPEKRLLEPQHKSGGRNHDGKMTMRYMGGGNKPVSYTHLDVYKRQCHQIN